MEFAKKDTPAARKLIDVVTKLIDKLKETVKKLTPNGKAAKLLQEDIDAYAEARDLWYEGIEKMMEQNAKGEESTKTEEVANTLKNKRYSIKEIPDTIKEDLLENRKIVAKMDPIAELEDTLFEKSKKTLSEQVLDFFNERGNNAYNDVVGDVELSKKGIDDDIAHGMGRAKAITYAAVPQVIEEGKIIDYQQNWKNRGYDTIVFAAPVKIKGEHLGGEYLEAVIARRSTRHNVQRFYVHEALSIEKEKLAVLDWRLNKIHFTSSEFPDMYTLLHNTLKYKWEDEKNNDKFSMKDEEKDNIFQKDTLSKSEWAMFYSKIGEKKNRYYFPKAADGNYIMTINNKLVYTNGNWESPRIDRVIEIDVDGVSGIERSTYISYIQEELIEYEKDGREVSKEILDDIKELNQITYGGKVYIKGYSTENTASGKRQRTTDTVSIHGESGGAVKEQSNRRRDKKIYESERSGNLKEKFSLKEPVEETKEGNEKDSSKAAVNKLDGVRFSIKDFDNLISLPDMQIENSKMDIVSKDTSRADIRERAFENIQNSKYGRRDGNKCFIKNKYLGDVMITKDSIRHIIVKINENRMIAALNIAKYLPESIVINQTDGARKGANKSYVLLGMMEDGTNQYILRTVLNSYENEYEVSEANVVYSVASKKTSRPISAKG